MGADPSLSPELIQAQAFTSGFRGYDQSEVREFLGRVAAEIRALREQTDRLESAWHSAEERAARPPVLDEDTLMAAVGDETASILRAARSAAADMRSRATQESERMIAEAEARGAQILSEADGVLARETKAADEAASRVVDSARSEAAEMVDKARTEADAIRGAAQQEKTLTIEGAIATRERILEDLSRRRRVASVQIEQLRAGRERLLESYSVVRRTLEEVNDELNRADAEARAAADEVGRRMQREHQSERSAGADSDDEGIGGEPAEPTDAAAPAGPDSDPGPAAPATGEAPAPAAPASPAAEPAPEPVVAPSVGAPSRETSGGVRGGGRRRGRGGASASAEALATAIDHSQGLAPSAEVPHLRVVPDAQDAATDAPGSKVDVLFARIRSGTPEPQVEDEPAHIELENTPAGADEADADETVLQQREGAVLDLESSLTRKLKRTMQDEQNDLLDRLRSLRGEPTAARLLPDLPEQIARYAGAAQQYVDLSAAAGVAFAADALGRKRRANARVPVVTDLATEAATTIVESLRRRLEHAISAATGDEQSVLVEGLGSAYREWKSERIERIAGDVLAAAFSRGTWHEVPEGTLLRWVVEDMDGPCPDCDDDALAGNLPKGEVFPTGQPYPPAHPGCRCLLVPVKE